MYTGLEYCYGFTETNHLYTVTADTSITARPYEMYHTYSHNYNNVKTVRNKHSDSYYCETRINCKPLAASNVTMTTIDSFESLLSSRVAIAPALLLMVITLIRVNGKFLPST